MENGVELQLNVVISTLKVLGTNMLSGAYLSVADVKSIKKFIAFSNKSP